jgi:hypothetical protein
MATSQLELNNQLGSYYVHTHHDLVDIMLGTYFTYLFLHCTCIAFNVYRRSSQYHCLFTQKLIIYLNLLQTCFCLFVAILVLLRHTMPWIFSCEVIKQLSILCLTISTGCVNGILVAFVFQSLTSLKQSHFLIWLGVIAIIATIGVSGFGYVAVEYAESTNGNCYLVVQRRSWVIIKFIVDLTIKFSLSYAYLNVLRNIVRDTGLSVYRALLRDGLIGSFLVLFSNILCVTLVSTVHLVIGTPRCMSLMVGKFLTPTTE